MTATAAYYAYDVSGYTDSMFLFELFDSDNERVAWSEVAGAALADYIGGTMSTISSPYVVTAVVPEPTGALLLLLGVAGLSLRRKRI